MSVKGFKAMSADMTCLKFKFKEGKTYETSSLSLCSSGFHFCEDVLNVYNYYPKSADTVICEIEALGEVVKEGDKSATNKIKIVRVLSDKEVLKIWINKNNTGDNNSGNRNSGNRNSGDWNSGNRNSGDWNSGDGNSGNRNSGYGNSGNRNSGDWNSGDGNSGYFNTNIPVYFFNKPSDLVYTPEFANKIRSINVKPILEWVDSSRMTPEEQTNNVSHKTTGGFLRKTGRHDFRYLTEADKALIKSLPNFDDDIFKKISGVSLSDDVEVFVNGVVKKISKADAKKLGLVE